MNNHYDPFDSHYVPTDAFSASAFDDEDNDGNNNNDDDYDVHDLAPTFRSVVIQQQPNTVSFQAASSKVEKARPGEHYVFPASNPLMGQPRMMMKSDDMTDSFPAFNPSAGIKLAGWTNYSLTPLEFYYPVAATHVTFARDRLSTVLQRLVEAFSHLSFQVEYENSPIRAVCTTLEQVKISVQVWQARKDANQVVLELLRVAGDGITWQRYTRYLLSLATEQSNETHDSHMAASVLPPSDPVHWDQAEGSATKFAQQKVDSLMQRSAPSPEEHVELPMAVTPRAAVSEALDIVQELIAADRRDARILGLESLVILTNPDKTDSSTATTVAQSVLTGRSSLDAMVPSSQSMMEHGTRDRVVGLAMNGRWLDDDDDDDTQSHSNAVSIANEYTSHASYLAWTFIAQSIQWLSAAEVTVFVQEADRLSGQAYGLVQKLMTFLGAAAGETPQAASSAGLHAAYLAAHILAYLCQSCPSLREWVSLDLVRKLGVGPSHQHAALHHALLRLWNVL